MDAGNVLGGLAHHAQSLDVPLMTFASKMKMAAEDATLKAPHLAP